MTSTSSAAITSLIWPLACPYLPDRCAAYARVERGTPGFQLLATRANGHFTQIDLPPSFELIRAAKTRSWLTTSGWHES